MNVYYKESRIISKNDFKGVLTIQNDPNSVEENSGDRNSETERKCELSFSPYVPL